MASNWRWPLAREGGPSYLPLSTTSTSPPPSSATSASSSTASSSASTLAPLSCLASSGTATPGRRRRRWASLFSSKTAVVLIALLGCIAHLYTFTYLGVMREAMPQVPSVQWHDATPVASSIVVLDSEVRNSNTSYMLNGSSATTLANTSDTTSSGTRWFNLLPKRPEWAHTSTLKPHGEQKSWQAAQMATSIARLYNFIGAMICAAGAYGALRSRVLLLRIFLIFAMLDTVIFTLTLVSFGIIVSYADVRALLCESITSGEVHAFFAYLRGHREGVAMPAPPDSPTYVDAAKAAAAASTLMIGSNTVEASITARSLAMRSSAEDLTMAVLPASLLSRTTQSLWRRTVDATSSDAASSSMWRWDTWLDDLLESESCDDVFATYIVPIGVFVCLVTLLVRIRLLFVIRAHYISVVREQANGSSRPVSLLPASEPAARQSRMSEKGASTFLSPGQHRAPRSKPRSDRIRQMQEKMA